MQEAKCDKCGQEARMIRQIIEYNRVNPDTGEMSVIKTTFIYECSACDKQKTVDVVG